ncbi:MAG: PadR family transcriptional regulator [Candidatus Phytoplasma sp.]|nr:PadR family transcriptional regulator [Phytoplasma sp.]
MEESTQLIKGYSKMITFSILIKKDSYVYEICKLIEKTTNGIIIISNPSLLAILKACLENREVTTYKEINNRGVERIYYKITKLGIDYFLKHQEYFINSLKAMSSIIEGDFKIYDK